MYRARIEEEYARSIERLNKNTEFSAEIGFVCIFLFINVKCSKNDGSAELNKIEIDMQKCRNYITPTFRNTKIYRVAQKSMPLPNDQKIVLRLDLFVKLKYESSVIILLVGIRYSTCDQLSDLNNCA